MKAFSICMLLAFGAFACLSSSASTAHAQSNPLQGTWIAIDDGFPRLVGEGHLVPTEEILHVDADGLAESRLMMTSGLDTHYMCMAGWGCSDMTPVRRAQARLSGADLVFTNIAQPPEAAAITHNAQARAAELTLIAASPRWALKLSPDLRQASFEADGATRYFARIDPERLNKLRAGLSPLPIPYGVHWRCFLSNATAHDPAFDAMGGPRKAPGPWFEDYLTAALQLHRLSILVSTPVRDDDMSRTDPLWAKSATMPAINTLLGGSLAYPVTNAQRIKHRGVLIAISGMVHFGDETRAFEAARQIDPTFNGEMGVPPAALAALAKVMRQDADLDLEVRDLFCLDLKDAPAPRPQFDPFRGRFPN